MFSVVLFEPEIAPNTGNIIRLCANCGAQLHLIRPLGFDLDDRKLRRAGLDYHEWARVQVHDSYQSYVSSARPPRTLAFTAKARDSYADVSYTRDDALLFGPETRGLTAQRLEHVDQMLRIPMQPGGRSLNLSNAVAVICYEAWRQLGFPMQLATNDTADT